MIRFSSRTLIPMILLLVFSIVIVTKDFFLSYLVEKNKMFGYLAFLFGFVSKLFSGILECCMRKGFKKSIKHPSPLACKDFFIYVVIIIIEILVLSQVNTFINGTQYYTYTYLILPVFSSIQIFFICIFSYLILKYKFGNHKKTGLTITAIGIIPIMIKYFIYDYNSKHIYGLIIINILIVFKALTEVLVKYLLLIKNQSPYLLLFITGIPQSIILIIVYFVLFNTKEQYQIDYSIVLLFIWSIFTQVLFHYARIAINFKYTPSHKIVSDCIGLVLSSILLLIFSFKSFNLSMVLEISGNIICLIGSIIYNEIIIISVWNLDKDTAEGIKIRALNEEIEDTDILKIELDKSKQKILEKILSDDE